MSMTCCDFQISENRKCGSYAFNLWQEGIKQKYCDRHHWQSEATRLRAALQSMTEDRDSWERQAGDRVDDALRFARERDSLKAEVESLRHWLNNNMTFMAAENSGAVLTSVSRRIWYHATDDCDSYPFSAVIDAARAAQGDKT